MDPSPQRNASTGRHNIRARILPSILLRYGNENSVAEHPAPHEPPSTALSKLFTPSHGQSSASSAPVYRPASRANFKLRSSPSYWHKTFSFEEDTSPPNSPTPRADLDAERRRVGS